MKAFLVLVLPGLLLLAGCSAKPTDPDPDPAPRKTADSSDKEAKKETKIKAALAKLPAEDKAAAEAQKFCAVETGNRLGGMAVPVKVMIDGQPVFLCCKGCKSEALKDKEKTLAAVKELKEKNKETAK